MVSSRLFLETGKRRKRRETKRKSGNSTKRTGVPTEGKSCNVACVLRNFSNGSFPSPPSILFYFPRIRRRRTILTKSNGISLMTYFFTVNLRVCRWFILPRRPSSVNTSSTNPLTRLCTLFWLHNALFYPWILLPFHAQ